MHTVELFDKTTGKRFKKEFESLFLCRKFVNKCKHSKKLVLISYPYFN